MSDLFAVEAELEKAKLAGDGPRIRRAEEKLYQAQKRQFEASIRRRAKAPK